MMVDAMKRSILFLALLGASTGLGAGCAEESEEDIHAVTAPDCEAIGEACDHDVPGELAEECHELAHSNDAAECTERRDECVEYCTSQAGEGGASGATH